MCDFEQQLLVSEPLLLLSSNVEQAFRRHYRSWVIPRIRVGVQIQMALNLVFGALELIFGYSAGAVMAVLCLRLMILVNLTVFSSLTLAKKFHRIMDPSTLGCYIVSCRQPPVFVEHARGRFDFIAWYSLSTVLTVRAPFEICSAARCQLA